MDLFISYLLIGLFLLFFSINIKSLNFAFVTFSSILFLAIGVLILTNGDTLFSDTFIETYTYLNSTLISIQTNPVSTTSIFTEGLGVFSILSSIYIFIVGIFNNEK